MVDNADQAVLRWIFRVAVTVTIVVLAVDLATMQGWIADPDPAVSPAEITPASPASNLPGMLPSILAPLLPGGDKRLMPLPQPDGAMAKPMTFELVSGGRLMATGTITPGISQSFAAEVGKRGDYVKTVVLSSPGGSVTDALAMGRLIRERNSQQKSKRENTVCPHVRWCLPAASSDAPATGLHSACIKWRRSVRAPRAALPVMRCALRKTSRRVASAISATWASACRSGCMRWRHRTTDYSCSSLMS
jgi:hypothetical protein